MKILGWLVGLLVASSCVVEDEPALSSTAESGISFEEFKAQTPTFEDRYVVEGDILLSDDDALREYWERRAQPGALSMYTHPVTGAILKWSNTQKMQLTWCVNTAEFGPVDSPRLIRAIEQASREWEARANVNFTHYPAQDGAGCTNANTNVFFNVHLVYTEKFAAATFTVGAPRSKRELFINGPSMGNTPGGLKNLVGHELGHILGFRHESSRPEAPGNCVWDEEGTWAPVTPFDIRSIMMTVSPCNQGLGGWSDLDRVGAAWAYGVGNHSRSDILWRHTSGAAAVWTMWGGTPGYGGSFGPGLGWTIQGTGDFDGNGTADVLWRSTTGALQISFMQGTTQRDLVTAGAAALDWKVIGVGDFNGDQQADILWHKPSSNMSSIWFMNGATIAWYGTPWGPPTSGGTWSLQGIGDLDNDGDSDLLWRSTTGALKVWTMKQDQPTVYDLGAVHTDWQIAGRADSDGDGIPDRPALLGDFDGDGNADILWRHTDGTLAIWFYGASYGPPLTFGKTWEGYPGNPGANWQVAGIGDFNGDWKTDILLRMTSGTYPTLQMWFMDGQNRAAPTEFPPGPPEAAWSVQGVNTFD